MSGRKEISRLLVQWMELSQAEGEAIQAAAWGALVEVHAAKAELQNSINSAIKSLESEGQKDAMGIAEENAIRAEVKRLISLEGRNQDLLSAQRKELEGEKDTLDMTRRNLRKVRQSYAGQTQTLWEQYS